MFEVIEMPYDYYEELKKQKENEEYVEIGELVRQNIWSESINFKQSIEWIGIEDKMLIRLYPLLRYN